MRWWIKAAIQTGLSKLPYGEEINYRLQLRNGFRESLSAEVTHGVEHLCKLVRDVSGAGLNLDGAVAVEVGTGWVPTVPLGLALLGARVYSYDHLAHLRACDVQKIAGLLYPHLPQIGHETGIDPSEFGNRLDRFLQGYEVDPRRWLRSIGVEYLAPADAAATTLAAGVADLHFSINVFEHVSLLQLEAIVAEAYRILKSGAFLWHRIDTQDHYSGLGGDRRITHVNFLKYSDLTWRLIAQNRIHYTNRLRQSEYLTVFRHLGFELVKVEARTTSEDAQTLRQVRIHPKYLDFDERELAMRHFTVTAVKP